MGFVVVVVVVFVCLVLFRFFFFVFFLGGSVAKLCKSQIRQVLGTK